VVCANTENIFVLVFYRKKLLFVIFVNIF